MFPSKGSNPFHFSQIGFAVRTEEVFSFSSIMLMEPDSLCNPTDEFSRQKSSASEVSAASGELSPGSLPGALARYGVQLSGEQILLVDQFARMLWDWNQKINLTRHTDYEKFVVRDVVDSLVFAEFLQPGEKVLDVGSGGGVPGTLLAILRPDLRVWLSESIGKKAKAAEEIVRNLGLKVMVFHGRAEHILAKEPFNSLTIRAVARLKELLQWFKPYWDQFDRMLVLKGPSWVQERGEARHYGLLHGLALRKLKTYSIPNTGAESVLLQICPEDRLVDKKQCRLRS